MAQHADTKGDNKVAPIIVHRSVRSVLPQFLFAALAAALVWYLLDRNFNSPVRFQTMSSGLIVLPVWPLVLAVLLARPFVKIFDTRHSISEHHVRSERGRMSIKREEVEVAFENLHGVKLQQGIAERMLNVGSIIGWTGIAEHPDVVMPGIYDPHTILKLLGARVDQARLKEPPAERQAEGRSLPDR